MGARPDSSSQINGSYWLVGLAGNDRRVRLYPEGPLLVGRGAHNHLVLNDYRISRQHARVAFERDGFFVYDLNSANGTFVNGESVRRQKIEPNDEVRFGPYGFKMEFEASPQNTTSPATWRRNDSITMFQMGEGLPLPPASRPVAGRKSPQMKTMPEAASVRDTIRPPDFAVEEITSSGDILPVSRNESSRFRAETATVDLNQLENAYDKLNTLYAFMQAISKTIHRRELLELIAGKILTIYPAARSVGIYLRAPRDPNAAREANLSRETNLPPDPNQFVFRLIHAGGDGAAHRTPVLPAEIGKAVSGARRAIFDAEASKSTQWGPAMYAPMIDREQAFGVIAVAAGEKSLAEFAIADLELLNGIAVSAAIMMQNTLMLEASLQRERLNRDLELAAQIQRSFLPREMLQVPGVEFLATYRAAYTVGGDFYDMFWVDETHIGLFVGDISGKGIAASLLMARFSGELRVAALAHVDPVSVLTMMNHAVLGRGQPEVYFTCIYLTLEVNTGEVWLASAGQPSPYVVRADGKVDEITEGGSPAVGMIEDAEFVATRFVLGRGDSLVLHTDGVVEAAALDGSLYGADRLAACLRGAGARPADIAEQILRSVGHHAANAQQNDDLTIVICHRSREDQPKVTGPVPRKTNPVLKALRSGPRG